MAAHPDVVEQLESHLAENQPLHAEFTTLPTKVVRAAIEELQALRVIAKEMDI